LNRQTVYTGKKENERGGIRMLGYGRPAIIIARLRHLSRGGVMESLEYGWLAGGRAMFGADEEFIFGGKVEGLLWRPKLVDDGLRTEWACGGVSALACWF
jgi:hypothetical protein